LPYTTLFRSLNGSAAAQNTPPAASRVHIIIEIHLKVLISGFSIFPNLMFPYLENPNTNAIKNVPNNTIWYTLPKYLTENAKELFTIFVTTSWLIKPKTTNIDNSPTLINNTCQSINFILLFAIFKSYPLTWFKCRHIISNDCNTIFERLSHDKLLVFVCQNK